MIIIFVILNIIFIIYLFYLILKYSYLNKTQKDINDEIIKENSLLEKYNKELKNHNTYLKAQSDYFLIEKTKAKELNDEYQQYLKETLSKLNTSQKDSQEAFEKYWDILEEAYKKKEEEYINAKENMKNNFLEIQAEAANELTLIQERLQQMKNTEQSILKSKKREKEIEEEQSFYCLQLTDIEKDDIEKLENIKPLFHQPRALSMLIWTSYIRGAANVLCNNVLNKKQICGIYKITNLTDKTVYIGQSRDIGERWKEHIKAGLGIDTPANNKLYKTMQKNKVWNFAFELLEECNKDLLNEKEKYYIDFYDSVNNGMNTLSGVK